MQTSSINPPAKLQRRHTGTKPGEEIKVRVEGHARVTNGDRPGVPSGPARQASKGHATDHISSHSAFSLPGPGYALPPKPCRRPPYGPPLDPPATGSKKCRIEVWSGRIFLGFVHNWIQVVHCDGTKERFEVWQNSKEMEDLRARYPNYVPPLGQMQLGDTGRSHVFRNLLELGEWGPDQASARAHCVKEFDCTTGAGGKWNDPPPCECVSTKTASKYSARYEYSYIGINSNTFVQQFLKHCKIDCPLPDGSAGEGAWSEYDFFAVDFEMLMQERYERHLRRHIMHTPGQTGPPRHPGF